MKKTAITLSIFISTMVFSQTWNTTGNSGTNPTTNFIGTTDNQSLVFKTNNSEKLKISPTGRLIFLNLENGDYSKNLYLGGGNENIQTLGGSGDRWLHSGNVAVGLGSLTNITTGGANTAIGFFSMNSILNGGGNTAIGINSMKNSISTFYNTAIGHNSMIEIKDGRDNTAVGTAALNGRASSGTITTNATGNTVVGANSMRGISYGNYNTILGNNSYRVFNYGNNNIVVGYNNLSSYELSGVNNNIFIGNNISPINSQPNNELNIGNWIYGLNGKISIGGKANYSCSDCSDYSLFVKNGIKAEKVKVDIASANGWADYVFKKDYQLQTLEEVEKHITNKGHLPNVPSAEEVAKNGINVAEMDAKLLEKIEELTLYSIEQNKQIKKLQEENSEFKKQAEKIEKLEKLLLELTSKK